MIKAGIVDNTEVKNPTQNANVSYCFDEDACEDAVVVSEKFAKSIVLPTVTTDDDEIKNGEITVEFKAYPYLDKCVDALAKDRLAMIKQLERQKRKQDIKDAAIFLIKLALAGVAIVAAVTLIVAWAWLEL